jgi:hypothetical protein
MRRLADRLRELRQRLVFHWRVFLHALLRVPAITTPPAGPKLIVSLTTYSRRLHLVHRTVESLVAQSSRPDALIVWIWSGDLPNGELPRPLARLQKLGVTVRVVDEDLRSYKKLVHALEEFPDSAVITCDDDIIYPYSFVEGLVRKSTEHPDVVVGYRCTFIRKDAQGIAPYLAWQHANDGVPSFNILPTGAGGILYPPGVLNREATNRAAFMKLAPTADDLWFKVMALLNNTKAASVGAFSEFPLIPGSQEDALWKINNGQISHNDLQWKSLQENYEFEHLLG